MKTIIGNLDWNHLKDKFKTSFGKFTIESLESVKGSLDFLSDKLQQTYGQKIPRTEGAKPKKKVHRADKRKTKMTQRKSTARDKY